jgi:hypothetical protein
MIHDDNFVLHPLGERLVYELMPSSGGSSSASAYNYDALQAKLNTLVECRDFIAGFDASYARIRNEIAQLMYSNIYGPQKAFDAARATFHLYSHASAELVRAYLLKFCALAECDAEAKAAVGERPAVAVDDRGVWFVPGDDASDGRVGRTFVFHAVTISTQLTFARVFTILAQLPAPKHARRAPRRSETPLQYLLYIARHM